MLYLQGVRLTVHRRQRSRRPWRPGQVSTVCLPELRFYVSCAFVHIWCIFPFSSPLLNFAIIVHPSLRPPAQDHCEQIEDLSTLTAPLPRTLRHLDRVAAMISISHKGAVLVRPSYSVFSVVLWLLTNFSLHFCDILHMSGAALL
jgi:hypothetical protein